MCIRFPEFYLPVLKFSTKTNGFRGLVINKTTVFLKGYKVFKKRIKTLI